MSALGRLRSTLAKVGSLLAVGARRVGRQNLKAWLIHGRHADIVIAAIFFAVVAASLAFLAASDATTIMVGVPPLAFILFELVREYRAAVARKREESDDIADARSLAEQCKRSLGLIAKSLLKFPEDYRTYMALNLLSSEVRLLVTRYRRHLSQGAVSAVLEAEKLILEAELSRSREIGMRMRAIDRQLDIIGGGIDIDARGQPRPQHSPSPSSTS